VGEIIAIVGYGGGPLRAARILNGNDLLRVCDRLALALARFAVRGSLT
jgi:hypothetical protein